MPTVENAVLREQFLVLMVAAVMHDYSEDSVVVARLGKLLAQQADDRAASLRLPNSNQASLNFKIGH